MFQTNPDWKNQSQKNYIEVALVDILNENHQYIIDNKGINLPKNEPLIVRIGDKATNILDFRLIDEDFENGFKK